MVRVEQRDDVGPGVVVITLDRPDRRNAVDHATVLALLEAQRGAREADARVVVLTGAPPAFCAGADLAGVREDVFAADLKRVLAGFVESPCPVLAAIDGPALGAGAQFVAVSDLRIATPASIIGVPAAKLGLVIDRWIAARIAQEFGDPVARGMLLAAERYTGERLYATGAVHRLGDLDAALDWAGEIAGLAPLSNVGHKLALESLVHSHDHAPEVVAAQQRAWASADAAEGRTAFLEKRPPNFQGR
jgi:enoyl-CoA hydratase